MPWGAQITAVGRTKFMVHLCLFSEAPEDTAYLLGKVGEDLGTDPIQPLDNFSLEQTHRLFSPQFSPKRRCRPAPGARGSE